MVGDFEVANGGLKCVSQTLRLTSPMKNAKWRGRMFLRLEECQSNDQKMIDKPSRNRRKNKFVYFGNFTDVAKRKFV
jgi:hypothetical protein